MRPRPSVPRSPARRLDSARPSPALPVAALLAWALVLAGPGAGLDGGLEAADAAEAGAESLAELRPAELQAAGISAEAAASGRDWIARVQERYGRPAFERFATAEVVLRDDWPNEELRAMFLPWPENDRAMRFDFLLDTFTSRVEFVGGPRAGEQWGLQQWVPYLRPPGGEREFLAADSEHGASLRIWMPTFQYFVELPFRLPEIPIVADTGEDTVGGKLYRRLFVTWRTAEPHVEEDQYLLWIDPESSLIERLAFTIRDFAGAAVAQGLLSDFREVQGVTLPFAMTFGGDPEGGDISHRIVLESVRFDAGATESELVPDPDRHGSKPVPGG